MSTRRGGRIRPAALLAIAAVCAAPGCFRPLPEEGSADMQLYVQRCGGCHVAHHPSALTASMWDVMVKRMDAELQRRGMPPLVEPERGRIMAYLLRYAEGTQQPE